MGSSRWDPSDWSSYSSTTTTKTRAEIFKSRNLDPDLDPSTFDVRESRDSEANPESTPIIIAVDVTGSMGHLAEEIVKRGLGVIMKEIYERVPVTDPHVMIMAIGDCTCDQAPIQMTQFEAAVDPLTKQIEKIYIEGGGGGNSGESYNLAWYGALNKTSCDAIQKRGRKGYIFTIGDEPNLPSISADHIKRFFGATEASDVKTQDLLDLTTQSWEVFHLMVGRYDSYGSPAKWSALLGERAIKVTDHNKLAEVIVSTLQVVEGANVKDVVDSWSGDTSLVVSTAISGLTKRSSGGVVAL